MRPISGRLRSALRRILGARAPHIGEQLFVAAGQGGAGLGNLAFSVVMARMLPPEGFAVLVAFLALYLLIHVPASSLSAGSALEPTSATRHRWRVAGLGAAIGVGLIAAAGPVSAITDLPPALVVAAAAALPGAGVLAMERGRLYGRRSHGRVVASLLAEPAVRLTVAVALALTAGALGASLGVVLAGYVALAVASSGPRRPVSAGDTPATGVGGTIIIFLLVALVQNQDVLLANGILAPRAAADFAVLSTLGGIALFAAWNIPMVLMPRSAAAEQQAVGTAVALAAAVGVTVTLAVWMLAAPLVGLLFGERYVHVAPLAVWYVGAMAFLGIARVLVAHRSARGRIWTTAVVVTVAASLQAASIWFLADDVLGVVTATGAATVGLTAVLGVVVGMEQRSATAMDVPRRTRESSLWRTLVPLALITATGFVVRVVFVTRGLWLDEAITWSQATMAFGEMIEDVRFGDVHPPLYHTVMWAAVRALGESEFALRLPSIIAGTIGLPVLYLVGRDSYSKRVGLVAATLGVVSPLWVWYSQEARMYSFLLLFSLLAVWLQIRVLQRPRAIYWIAFTLTVALMLWTQYFALLQVATHYGIFLVVAWIRRRRGRPVRGLLVGVGISLLAVVLMLLPLAPLLQDQIIAYQNRSGAAFEPGTPAAGLGPAAEGSRTYRLAANVIWALTGYHAAATMEQLAAAWPLGMLAGLALLGRGPWRLPTGVIGAAAMVPFTVLFTASWLQANLFEVRYVIVITPLLIVLLARLIDTAARRPSALAVALAVAAAALGWALTDQQTNRQNPRIYDFEGELTAIARDADRGDLLVYQPPYIDPLIRYYAGDVRHRPLDHGVPELDDYEDVYLLAVPNLIEGDRDVQETVDELTGSARVVEDPSARQVLVWRFR